MFDRRIIGVVTILACVLGGCVKTAYLPTDERGRYAPSKEIEVFWEAPTRPYTIIGRVSATSGAGEEKIFRKLKQRAAAKGAQALIMGGSTQTASVVGVPMATGGTLITSGRQHRLEALAIRWTTGG
jgi:hypothetical protein